MLSSFLPGCNRHRLAYSQLRIPLSTIGFHGVPCCCHLVKAVDCSNRSKVQILSASSRSAVRTVALPRVGPWPSRSAEPPRAASPIGSAAVCWRTTCDIPRMMPCSSKRGSSTLYQNKTGRKFQLLGWLCFALYT